MSRRQPRVIVRLWSAGDKSAWIQIHRSCRGFTARGQLIRKGGGYLLTCPTLEECLDAALPWIRKYNLTEMSREEILGRLKVMDSFWMEDQVVETA